MGLLLLVPGLIFLLNQVTWFEGEEAVGLVLTVVGGVLLLVQVIWAAIVGRQVKKQFDSFDSRFGRF